MEPTAVEDEEDLEDLVLGQKESGKENTASDLLAKAQEVKIGGYIKAQEVKMGGYAEALKRIEDIEKELKGVEGQMLIKKRKFSS